MESSQYAMARPTIMGQTHMGKAHPSSTKATAEWDSEVRSEAS